jgi:hypothetical protein
VAVLLRHLHQHADDLVYELQDSRSVEYCPAFMGGPTGDVIVARPICSRAFAVALRDFDIGNGDDYADGDGNAGHRIGNGNRDGLVNGNKLRRE